VSPARAISPGLPHHALDQRQFALGGSGNIELFTDFRGGVIENFPVAGYGSTTVISRILPNRMITTFADKLTTMVA
jgi:hypothetical protein